MKSPEWTRERLLHASRILRAQPPEAEWNGINLRELGLDLLDLVADTYAQEAIGRVLSSFDAFAPGPESRDAVREQEDPPPGQPLRLIEGGNQ